ncbi:transposase [Listeria innocua]|uniref:Transposase n=3 Tax=Listeria innocua TaxID=1642 RepID=A0AB73H738_LISIO|nr:MULTISPECIES: transposase [Listeria]EFR91443.1 IS3 family transposase OrfA [Listeria innocua FSL S4-378]MWW18216.1 transposase [Listeria monocytogenes]QPQ96619.1 transposase [Listeria welshimeri]EAA0094224.1 transposase [Listeria innocua]EAC4268927.1 transposase [Listeria innocua]
MPTKKYTEKFKISLVYLYRKGTSKQTLCEDFGVSSASLSRWIKWYDVTDVDLNEAANILQMYELKKQKDKLEAEVLELTKAIQLFNSDLNTV